jgi:prephenate dehydrogenase
VLEEVSLDESWISQLEELLRDAPMRVLEVTPTGHDTVRAA